MSTHIYSEDQKATIYQNKSLSNIAYLDSLYAIKTLALHVYHLWKNNQKIVLVMPREGDRTIFTKILSELGLAPALLEANLSHYVNETDILKIKSRLKGHRNSENIDVDASIKYSWLANETMAFFTDHYGENNNQSWRKTLDKYLASSPDHQVKMLDINMDDLAKNMSEEDYKIIRSKIEEALPLYHKEFDLIESHHTNKLLHSQAQNAHHLHDVTYQLFVLKEGAAALRDKYNEAYQAIETTYIENVTYDFRQLSAHIFAIQSQLENYNPSKLKNNIFQIFSADTKKQAQQTIQFLDEWNHLFTKIYSKLGKKHQYHHKFPENAAEMLQEAYQSISTWKTKKLAAKTEFVKSINKFNYQDATITELENELEILIQSINQANILHEKLEYNTLSFNKQREFIHLVVQQLELAMVQIEKNLHYLQWKSFEESCDQMTRTVLTSLKSIDQDQWLKTYDTWYLWKELTNGYLHVFSDNNLNIKHLCQYHTKMITNEIEKYLQKNIEISIQTFEKIKQSNPDLYQNITKNKIPKNPVSWKYFFGDYNELISTLYPIVLSDSDQLEHINVIDNQHLITFNTNNVNYKILQLFTSVINYLPRDVVGENYDVILHMHEMDENQNIHHIAHSERLPLMRAITDVLTSFQQTPEIFQLKDACLLSFTTPYITSRITTQLYDLGIKRIYAHTDIHETILSTLLSSENHIYILTEEGIFSQSMDINSIMLQSDVVQKLQKIGCEFLDIKLSSLIQKGENTLTPIVELIRRQQLESTKSTKQTQLELV